jgi:hypothetical protein
MSNMSVLSHPPYCSLFTRLDIKLNSHHFETIEVIEAESQAVLSTLTDRDFQDAFKKIGKSVGNGIFTLGLPKFL